MCSAGDEPRLALHPEHGQNRIPEAATLSQNRTQGTIQEQVCTGHFFPGHDYQAAMDEFGPPIVARTHVSTEYRCDVQSAGRPFHSDAHRGFVGLSAPAPGSRGLEHELIPELPTIWPVPTQHQPTYQQEPVQIQNHAWSQTPLFRDSREPLDIVNDDWVR